jgi:RNA polymerase sigma-70 factor (ECF subfamily)
VNDTIETTGAPADDFEPVVTEYYELLFRFALSLTGSEADARDLTQQTFYVWCVKRHQLRDRTRVKSWLYTILHREFLQTRKRAKRFPHFDLESADDDLPVVSPSAVDALDGARVVQLLSRVPEPYRGALNLFYLEDLSYKEIAAILEIPLGTVRSRIARGIKHLQQAIRRGTDTTLFRRSSAGRKVDHGQRESSCEVSCSLFSTC